MKDSAKETIKREDDGTIRLSITIPSELIKKSWDLAIDKAAETTTIQGFRKGKAPRDMVEANVDRMKIREQVLQKLVPEMYTKTVEEHHLKPIINPQIHIDAIEDGKDWTFTALTCEMPEVKLNDYKDAVKSITAKSKIIIPGKEEETKEPDFNAIVKILLEHTEVVIPAILIDGEVERLLSQLLDEVKKLGLTVDQYLASSQKTAEDLRTEYEQKAKNDIHLEFVMSKIAEEEKIMVEPQEVEEALLQAKTPEERTQVQSNMYLLASILRQQKTLDFLKNL